MEQIYTSVPINKTAALVTNQTGCRDSGQLSKEQMRENLVLKVKKLRKELATFPKNHPKKIELGRELEITNLEINRLRPKRKAPGVEHFFINAARDHLCKFDFNAIMAKAVNEMRTAVSTTKKGG